MKSKKFILSSTRSGEMSPYRQIQVNQFWKFSAALSACEVANNKVDDHHYILNESGKEYHGGAWID
ncbi:hypothetical protein ACFL3U_04085 [Pseudomonadota bacterium]